MSSFFHFRVVYTALQRDHVLRLRTFLAISYVELDFLSVRQCAETIAFYGAEMYEYVGTVLALDEAEALAFVKPFNGAGC